MRRTVNHKQEMAAPKAAPEGCHEDCSDHGLSADGEDDCNLKCQPPPGDGGSGSYWDVGCQQGEFCNFDDGSSGFCEGCVADCYDSGLPAEGEMDCSSNC